MLPKKYQRWENAAHWFMGSVAVLFFVFVFANAMWRFTSLWWMATIFIWFPICSILLYVPGWLYQRKIKRLEQPKK